MSIETIQAEITALRADVKSLTCLLYTSDAADE